MRRAALLTAAVLAFSASAVRAQTPSFAGTWTMQQDPNAAAAGNGRGRGGGGGFGMTFTATQDAKMLTITRTTQAGETKSMYMLDGSDSKNSMAGRQGAPPTDVISHAKWNGSKLDISTTRDFNGQSMTTTQTLSLDASGNLLVSTTRPGQDGTPMTSTVTYKKS